MIIRHIYLGNLPITKVYQNGKLIWTGDSTISVKAFSFLSSYATADATVWMLLPFEGASENALYSKAHLSLIDIMCLQSQAVEGINSQTDAIMHLFTLHPFFGISTNNLNGKAYLLQASSVIHEGIAHTDTFGTALARLHPVEIIGSYAPSLSFDFGMSNAFPIIRSKAGVETYSFVEGIGYACDAIFVGGWARVPTVKIDGIGNALQSVRGKGKDTSKSDTWSIAWAIIPKPVQSNAISQIDIIGVAHNPLAAHTLALQSLWSDIIGTGYAAPALLMNGQSALATIADAHALLLAIDAILVGGAGVSHVYGSADIHDFTALRNTSSAKSVTGIQGNILPTSAITGDGSSHSENNGKGTMKVWHLPILNRNTLKIRQAYMTEVTDGVLSVR